ncbi:TetR/AcrR family transcriptional regulator [Streptomyces sp. NRRL F-5123]|uniref:TetR/AcrR family transcriptional regulator n=1 Tax=Streptomyces sp. NRRL F-5123 TaxID=1463856 RepID=UPI000694B005|nr:TetR/AcrR family transcriptional regulator [Streptomyces sp. NRRL F-5123]
MENVRVRRTRKLLRDALIELIEERGFDRVTVGEICARAMVSRAAFYRSHRDKYQLVETIFDEAVEEMLGAMGEGGGEDGAERTPLERWIGFYEHIDGYHRFYGALLGRNGSPWFADRMRATLAAMVGEHLPRPPQDQDPGAGLVPTVLAAMSVQSIAWWLERGRPYPPRHIAVRSARLASAVIAEAQSWDEKGSRASPGTHRV